MSLHTNRIVLEWKAFDGDSVVGYYRLRCVSSDGYEWEGLVEWREQGDKKWQEDPSMASVAMTDLAVFLDRNRVKEDRAIRQHRLDAAALKRTRSCDCGGRAYWGAGFLLCDSCGWESDMNGDHGEAVKDWNKNAGQAREEVKP